MIALACDIGGTNTRLGLVRDGALLADSTDSYANDDFEDFYAVAATYLRARGGRRASIPSASRLRPSRRPRVRR